MYWAYFQLFASPQLWFCALIVLVLAIIPDVAIVIYDRLHEKELFQKFESRSKLINMMAVPNQRPTRKVPANIPVLFRARFNPGTASKPKDPDSESTVTRRSDFDATKKKISEVFRITKTKISPITDAST